MKTLFPHLLTGLAAFLLALVCPARLLATSPVTPGVVVAWGDNTYGQSTVPTGLSNVVQIAGGFHHSLALKTDGTVVAWGANSYGESTIPSGLSNVVQIGAGVHYSAALKSDGTVAAWGWNFYGESTVPSGLGNVVKIAVGHYHSLALKSDGTVVAWGYNVDGRCSIPSGLSNVVQIATGDSHSLALKSDGTVVAWGSNNQGACSVPSGLSNVVQVAGGDFRSVALKSDGTVIAWGADGSGQSTIPSGLSNVVQITAFSIHSLALKSDGTAVAWGDNSYGQSTIPNDLNNVLQVAAGGAHSLAIVAPLSLSDGLVAYYPFNGNANDASGNGNNGTVHGATLATDRLGSPNSAYSFDGAGNFISIPDNPLLALSANFTICAWYYQNNVTPDPGYGVPIVNKETAGIADGYGIYAGSMSDRRTSFIGASELISPGNFNVAQWHHIAVTTTGSISRMYVDGLEITSHSGGSPQTNTLPLFIGAPHVGCGGGCGVREFFNGRIDDVRIYNRALSAAEIAVLADYVTPSISTVSPSPVPGSNSRQNFTINGANFNAGCTVTLRDLTTGETFPNRPKLTQTATSITLNPIFGTPANTWSAEIINPGGISSGQYQFSVTSPANLVGLMVNGAISLAAGASTDFTATASFSSGVPQDVTSQASWSVSGGPSGTHMSGATLVAGSGVASTATVTASYAYTTGTRTATEQVAVGASWVPIIVHASAAYVLGSSPTQWMLDASGFIDGTILEPVTYQWKLDGAALATPQVLGQIPVSGLKSRRKLEWFVTDGTGLTIASPAFVTFNIPAINEPPSTRPPDDPQHLDTVYGSDGHSMIFDSAKKGAGFLLITHGMNASGTDPWLREMAHDIERRLTNEGKPMPNIAIYDWAAKSDPHLARDYDASLLLRLESITPRRSDSLGNFVSENTGALLGLTYDIQRIKPLAKEQSVTLAAWLLHQIHAGNIDPSQPIHLIGHSAGGFVTGEAASYLKQAGYIVDLVTMLDTPDPITRDFTFFPNPGRVERYISSVLGISRTKDDFIGEHLVDLSAVEVGIDAQGAAYLPRVLQWDPTSSSSSNVHPDGFYRREVFPVYWDHLNDVLIAHEEGHIAYDYDTVFGQLHTGFWYSPFLNGPKADKTGWTGSSAPSQIIASQMTTKLAASSSPSIAPTSTTTTLDGFQSFGTVTSITGGYQITEQDNAGISKQTAFSYGAITLRFKYQFTTPGDGDFFSVRVGDSAPLYVGADNELTENGFVTGEIALAAFANTADTIIFTLVSRGNANAVVQVKDIELVESDDPDGDGLTTAQELVVGTNPLVFDTDSDGLSDADEVNVYHTNPLLADTDGDGISDGDEITAGTDPLDSKSGFKVVAAQRMANGSFVLSWSAKVGKTYRVLRSTTVDFASFDVLAAGLEPATTTATYTDASLPPGTPAAFYRVLTE